MEFIGWGGGGQNNIRKSDLHAAISFLQRKFEYSGYRMSQPNAAYHSYL